MPANITSVPRSFFADCTNLQKVELPAGITEINYAAFDSCKKLTSINKTNSLENVTFIGSRAFCNCESLKFGDLVLSENLYTIGTGNGYAFANCYGITSVTIPGNVYSIEWAAFMNCINLETVIIEEGVRVIESAFSGCTKLESVILPASVTELDQTFYDCTALKELYILSDNCHIADPIIPEHSNTAHHTVGIPGVTTIYANLSSTAETYARLNGFTFKELPQTCDYGYHTYETKVLVGATCTEHGLQETICTTCGKSEFDGATFLLCTGHSGTTGTCSECGLNIIAGGDFDDCSWALDSTGTLTVYTTVDYYPFATGAPWADYANQITKFVFADSVVGHQLEYVEGIAQHLHYPNLTTIVVGAYTEMAFMQAFDAPKLANFVISEKNTTYAVKNGVLIRNFSPSRPEVWYYPASLSATTYRTGPISFITEGALKYATNIEKLYIDATLLYPKDFQYMTSLTDLYIFSEEWILPSSAMAKLGDPAKVTLHGVPGSMVQQIADEYGYKFVELTQCDINGVHSNTVLSGQLAPTCTTAGYSGDTHCTLCDEVSSRGEAIPATGHLWDKGTEKDGKFVYLCLTCGETKEQKLPSGMSVQLSGTPVANVLTEEEVKLVEAGASVEVYLSVNDISESVSAEEKALVAQQLGEYTVGLYLDIDLFKQIGDNQPVAVTETNGKIQISVKIPQSLLNTDKNITRSYKIVRIHEGVAEILDGTFNAATKEFTFETDAFSTYTIIYLDSEKTAESTKPSNPAESTKPTQPESESDVPPTGDTSNLVLWSMLLMISAMSVVLLNKKKQYS